ncbi:MAG TPA: tetratricopeptide repeat protein [Candidatus Saccharimonadales bacterium]|nr:tetratricopeptide repeat protein [Candidatus Saccharimonadales bacterium]
MAPDPYRDFRQAVDRPEDLIDLGRAALTIALPDYPDLDIPACLAQIDELAVAVTQRCGAVADVYRSLAALNYMLFTERRFRGNRDDYFDPKNSFLNEVLARKTGIPISLSVLYIEVAQRIGLKLSGVGFPGHFLVKYAESREEIVIDPFAGGEVRSREDLAGMIRQLYGDKVSFHAEFLEPVTKKQILQRMLANLKAIYRKKNDLVKSLTVLDRLIILDPTAKDDIRERGGLYLRLECFTQARADFEAYLRLAPDADDAASIREQIISLANQETLLH